MFNVRKTAAIMIGKMIIVLSRIFGNQGSNLPGKVASRLYPPLLKELGSNTYRDTFIITGTNGKTTTTNMIAAVLKENGCTYVHNQAGANMVAGITTAFIGSTNLIGQRRVDYALIEADEANVPELLQLIPPRYILITNFFRDQLDRYGELDHTINLIKEAVKESKIELILNADDPLQSHFEAHTGLRCWYYGFGDTDYDIQQSSESREGRYCVFCGHELEYSRYHYAQLGEFSCHQCGNRNPKPDFLGTQLIMDPSIRFKVSDTLLTSPYQGFYNAYNILAAVSLSRLAGVEEAVIRRAIASFHPAAGRQETFQIGSKKVVLVLVKNPTGLNQTLSMVAQDTAAKNVFIALNDNAADGRDISWIWDAEVEVIAALEANINRIICSGQRSGDMAVRVKYAGINSADIIIQPSLLAGIKTAVKIDSEVSYILCTYTALFAARKILVKMQRSSSKELPTLDKGTGEKVREKSL